MFIFFIILTIILLNFNYLCINEEFVIAIASFMFFCFVYLFVKKLTNKALFVNVEETYFLFLQLISLNLVLIENLKKIFNFFLLKLNFFLVFEIINNLFIILNLKNLILIKAFLLKSWINIFMYNFIIFNFYKFNIINKLFNTNLKSLFFFKVIKLNFYVAILFL